MLLEDNFLFTFIFFSGIRYPKFIAICWLCCLTKVWRCDR
jgi:hypothetical protein